MNPAFDTRETDKGHEHNQHIVPPSMETPGKQQFANINGLNDPKPYMLRREYSAPRLMIFAGLLTIFTMGAVFAILSEIWMQSALITAIAMAIWLSTGWWIRNLPISARSRQLDVQLNDARIRAESANHAKTRFLAVASHEMRTPLNGILGMSKLLEDTGLNLEQQNYNQAIKTSGDALFSFIEDMLDITRIEAGHFSLDPEHTNIRNLLENICELLSHRAFEKNLEIAVITDDDLPDSILIDKPRLQQVLVNLLGNAIKFTSVGGISLRARGSAGVDDKPHLQFVVTDTGPGIRDDDKSRVFGEFEQADINTTRIFGGAGLGLAISKAIVEKMHGTINIEDNHPQGTKIVVDIPVPDMLQGAKKTPVDLNPQRAGKVLLVSHRHIETCMLAAMIGQLGYKIETLTNLRTNNPLIKPDTVHAVIVDGVLVDDNIEIIKKHYAEKKLIVMLQPAQRNKLESYQAMGIAAYLIRPTRHDSLRRVLEGTSEFGSLGPTRVSQDDDKSEFVTPDSSRSTKNILLVEDNAINSLLARSVLEKQGHRVELAQNGENAIRAFENAIKNGLPHDLVYMDLHMPVMDGLTAIVAIREIEAHLGRRNVRIVTLSADEQKQTRDDVARAGGNGFLSKPVDPAQLATDAQIQIDLHEA